MTRANVVQCAITASLTSKAERLSLDSLKGRARAAATILPSNPTLSVTGGYPIEPSLPQRQLLWSATLSQELEIGGQRSGRLATVDSEQRAQRERLSSTQRTAGVDALVMYFDALAAREEAELAERLALLATSLKAAARARAEAGVTADVEAQLTEASATRLLQQELAAKERVSLTTATLATAVGLNPAQTTLRIEGDLVPLASTNTTSASFADTAVERRIEIQMARAEGQAQKHRVALLKRLPVPNPTLSVFARNDWIAERSLGVGIAFPIPFPAPVGKTYSGEIAEASALAQRAETDTERLRREVRLEVFRAVQALSFRKREAALYSAEGVRLTEDTLRSISEEVTARRLPVYQALLTQQALIDYLFAYVETKRQLCFASVELARAVGLPLDGAGL